MPTIKGVEVADYVKLRVGNLAQEEGRRLRDERETLDQELRARNIFKTSAYWERLGKALGPAAERIIERAIDSLMEDTRDLSLAENTEFWPAAADALNTELSSWVSRNSRALEQQAKESGSLLGIQLLLSQLGIGWKNRIQSRAREEVLRRQLRQKEQHSEDAHWMRAALEEAKKCVAEAGKEPRPKVACVAVRNGRELGRAHRSELRPGDHAEYTLLEKKLKEMDLAGATLYVTLEPCTARSPEKTPCAIRVVQRKLKRVVVAALDPNRRILGQGILTLQDAGIEVALAGKAEMDIAAELNREFIHYHRRVDEDPKPTTPSKKRRTPKKGSASK